MRKAISFFLPNLSRRSEAKVGFLIDQFDWPIGHYHDISVGKDNMVGTSARVCFRWESASYLLDLIIIDFFFYLLSDRCGVFGLWRG